MADVMHHGGDGGSEDPHCGGHWVPRQCEWGQRFRTHITPRYMSWRRVIAENKDRVRRWIEDQFDLYIYVEPEKRSWVDRSVDNAAERYRDYKSNAYSHFQEYETRVLYEHITASDMQKCAEPVH
ncbi:Uncharacterized protein Fot_03449 [Forsythia ovata]|uniref:Uncharacterized protein n=1 Tax=Forsythia ovata TaxID=205694 RepID=A0ABD1XDQ5_9LAMI